MNRIIDIIAIDGPAGAGKSSTARRVAAQLGFAFLDTGAMYRAATWRAQHVGADLDNPVVMAASTRAMQLEIFEQDGRQQVIVDGQDVTQAIRSPEVTRCIYKLDENPEVRAHLVDRQRAFGAQQPTVAEGRDMGTVVFPDAQCKIYLEASLDERARRRAVELEMSGREVDWAVLREEIRIRDEKTMTRAVSPLRRADDAVCVDTTGMTIDQAVEKIVTIARQCFEFLPGGK